MDDNFESLRMPLPLVWIDDDDDRSIPFRFTGDDEVGVNDGLLLVFGLNTSFVDELSLLIELQEYQLEERKDLKKKTTFMKNPDGLILQI